MSQIRAKSGTKTNQAQTQEAACSSATPHAVVGGLHFQNYVQPFWAPSQSPDISMTAQLPNKKTNKIGVAENKLFLSEFARDSRIEITRGTLGSTSGVYPSRMA